MPIDIAHIEFFTLVFIRTATALAVLPVFGHTAFPAVAKAGLAGLISLLLIPALSPGLPPISGTLMDYFMLAIRETVCGLLLGFAGQFLFYAVEIAGQLVGFQAGFSIVSSIDPNTESQTTVLTQFYNLTALLIFVTIDGHHFMLKALVDSMTVIPIGHLHVGPELPQWTLTNVTAVMADGVRLAAPLMVTLLVADIGLGILTRVAPTLNIFVLGFPLKIVITLVMISMTLNAVMLVFTSQVGQFARSIPGFLRLLAVP
ncbi:flagellar biosynthetic protein FliR [candidate division KSB1 bacterium]|nr:MAG: flagellar biosynthetic protein FliR [candidate division KSB1 bacterium]